MQNSHNITKFIRKTSTDYFCEEHNASYPTKKSLREDHPDIDDIMITIFDKRKLEDTIQFRLTEACINDKSHTQILMENT